MKKEVEKIREILEEYLKIAYGKAVSELHITLCLPSNSNTGIWRVNASYKVDPTDMFPNSAAFKVDLSVEKVEGFWEGKLWT